MPPEVGYGRARELLKERFGNDYLIADACVGKLTEGCQIKASDRVRLQELADDLGYCGEMLAAMGISYELNNQATLVKITDQLPSYLQNRWKREVRIIRERTLKPPSISDVSEFVKNAALEANDPV
jgi:hypothetical protein